MFKKLLLSIFVLGSFSAFAKPYGVAGCGLGNLLFKKEAQIFAATTNGTSASQLFGITSGTSNCVDTEGHAKLINFIDGNRVALENDVARADGETLQTVAFYFGCSNSEEFRHTLQKNFGQIFAPEMSPALIFKNLKSSLKENNQVSGSCSELG